MLNCCHTHFQGYWWPRIDPVVVQSPVFAKSSSSSSRGNWSRILMSITWQIILAQNAAHLSYTQWNCHPQAMTFHNQTFHPLHSWCHRHHHHPSWFCFRIVLSTALWRMGLAAVVGKIWKCRKLRPWIGRKHKDLSCIQDYAGKIPCDQNFRSSFVQKFFWSCGLCLVWSLPKAMQSKHGLLIRVNLLPSSHRLHAVFKII